MYVWFTQTDLRHKALISFVPTLIGYRYTSSLSKHAGSNVTSVYLNGVVGHIQSSQQFQSLQMLYLFNVHNLHVHCKFRLWYNIITQQCSEHKVCHSKDQETGCEPVSGTNQISIYNWLPSTDREGYFGLREPNNDCTSFSSRLISIRKDRPSKPSKLEMLLPDKSRTLGEEKIMSVNINDWYRTTK